MVVEVDPGGPDRAAGTAISSAASRSAAWTSLSWLSLAPPGGPQVRG